MTVCVCKAYPTAWRCTAFISHFPYPSFNPSIHHLHSLFYVLVSAKSCQFYNLCAALVWISGSPGPNNISDPRAVAEP